MMSPRLDRLLRRMRETLADVQAGRYPRLVVRKLGPAVYIVRSEDDESGAQAKDRDPIS